MKPRKAVCWVGTEQLSSQQLSFHGAGAVSHLPLSTVGEIPKGSVLEERFVTLVCHPDLAPPSNYGLPDQARLLGYRFLSAL